MMFRIRIAVLCGCVLALAGTAHADFITHDDGTTVTTVFSETYENQTVGAVPTDANVSPGPGTWDNVSYSGVGGNIVDVVNDAFPGAAEGSKYLQLTRPFDGSAVVTRNVGAITTGSVHAEFMVYSESDSVMFNASADGGNGMNAGTILALDPLSNGTLQKLTGGYGDLGLLQAAGGGNMTYASDQWQKWEFDFEMDTDTYVVTIDGVASEVTALVQTGRTLSYMGSRLHQGATAYLDAVPAVPAVAAVPEPASILLLGLGCLLLFGTRKNHRS